MDERRARATRVGAELRRREAGRSAGESAESRWTPGHVRSYEQAAYGATGGHDDLQDGMLRFEGFWVSRWGDENPEEKKRTVEELLRLMREKRFRDTPVVEVGWGWDTGKETLVEAVQGTLEGFRRGKGMFVFEDM